MITGQAFASVSWLTNHYNAKSPQLIHNVASLPIRSGDRVLDLGCGVGFYIEIFLKMVGPIGRVVGVDHDTDLISVARENLSQSGLNNWELKLTNVFGILENVHEFNRIILFNTLSYNSNYAEFVASLYDRMANDSLLIIKDFDMATSSYNPINKRIHGDLIEGVKKASSHNGKLQVNKLLGSQLHSLARKISGRKTESRLWPYLNIHPFSPQQEAFMRGAFDNSLSLAEPHCGDETISYIREQFIVDDAVFYKNNLSCFVENEHLVILPK